MLIIFSNHAKLRQRQRKITKSLVLETINKPDATDTSYRRRQLYRKHYGDKILEVVATQENSNMIIITQYWL